jgi:hypothetical protein
MLRTVVAGCVAVVGVGLLLAPDVTSARPGGFAGGRGIAAAPRALVAPPGFVLPKAGVVAPIRARPFAGFRHRRQLGSPATVWSSGDAAGYGYAQSPLVYPAADPNVYGAPDQGRIVYVPPPPGCRSESKTVPSEAGGERKITITRCWH